MVVAFGNARKKEVEMKWILVLIALYLPTSLQAMPYAAGFRFEQLYFLIPVDASDDCLQSTFMWQARYSPKWNSHSRISDFVMSAPCGTYVDHYARWLYQQFQSSFHNRPNIDLANFVLRFVSSLRYVEEKTDYWNTPYETLRKASGDCEDLTLLYLAIMKKLGFDTALIVSDQHAYAGVRVTSDGKNTHQVNDYLTCETTLKGALCGEKYDDMIPVLEVIPMGS